MSPPGNSSHPPTQCSAAGDTGNQLTLLPTGSGDPLVALTNLAAVRTRMDSLRSFLAHSLNRKILLPETQTNRVSSELVSAIHQIVVNGATFLASSQSNPIQPDPILINPNPLPEASPTAEDSDKEDERMEGVDLEVVELDAVELLAEHIHFCNICGKGFKRDANLRMHMRAHGNQFKTPEALAKPEKSAECNAVLGRGGGRRTVFSCPYVGCNRNQRHRNFQPLKSVICVKNHFKRSHCPKMYSCNRCHKKNFSVMADLKSHLKHCGQSRWKCSCGNTFSRKDKLFGHMALFEGHMPAVPGDEEIPPAVMAGNEPPVGSGCGNGSGNELEFEGLIEEFGFGSIDGQYLAVPELMMGAASSSAADLNPSMMADYFDF